LDDFVLE
jgi:uncharacterized protein (DUF433 family)